LEFASVSSALEIVPRLKTIRGARFTAVERSAAARIAVSQPLNSAWPPRAGSEAFATSIRSISPLPDRIRRRGFKGAIHIEHLSNHCGSAPVPKLNQEIKMFSKFALSAAIVISAACPALAATKHHHRVTHVHPAIYNMVPDTGCPANGGPSCSNAGPAPPDSW
jgi:hypothetical protein